MALHNRINGKELKENLRQSNVIRKTLSFYKYYSFENLDITRDHLYKEWVELGILGRVYIAHEGINAQISVPEESWTSFKDSCSKLAFMEGTRLNIAVDDNGKSFFKLKILVRKKIVSDGLNDNTFDVKNIGKHINAQELNEKIKNPNTLIVDFRNHYESEVGHFKNAITPDVTTFREALPHVNNLLQEQKDKDIILYCTGGIRCEKASAYLKHNGFQNVYQLEGGIIEYTRQVKELALDNNFIGVNFVFDERLGERISKDVISKCHQCGTPSDQHTNCANNPCHLLFIQCPSCAQKYQNTCSELCQNYLSKNESEIKDASRLGIFNGSKFSKARYNTKMGNLIAH